MASNLRNRPRAPSPKDFEDSDNTYSLVQDSMRDNRKFSRAPIDRMFGDSANESSDLDKRLNLSRNHSKFGSLSSNSTNSSSPMPKKSQSHYDAATVEQIKAQFQAQIEAMMLSQVTKFLLFLLEI